MRYSSVFCCWLFWVGGFSVQADYMDITSIFPGGLGAGSFTGTLHGAAVTGTLGVPGSGFTVFNPVVPGIGGSTIDGSSPQHSYAGIFTPITPLSDRVGFSAGAGPVSAHVTLTFSIPITNPTFHVANLDASFIDFAPSAPLGLTGMTLITGNGGAGDGLGISVFTIFDALPVTFDMTPIDSPPPMFGPRSAYGSILLSGTFSTLEFNIFTPAGIEDASFTISAVPEPNSILLCAIFGLGVVCRRRCLDRIRSGPVSISNRDN